MTNMLSSLVAAAVLLSTHAAYAADAKGAAVYTDQVRGIYATQPDAGPRQRTQVRPSASLGNPRYVDPSWSIFAEPPGALSSPSRHASSALEVAQGLPRYADPAWTIFSMG